MESASNLCGALIKLVSICQAENSQKPNGRKKLTWGGQVSAEVLADNRYDHSKSPVHPTGHCHGRDRYASFRDRYAKPQTAPSD